MPQTQVLVFREASGEVPFSDWFARLKAKTPKVYEKFLARLSLLATKGNELRRPIVDSLEEGIKEIRVRRGTVNYRILYFFTERHVIALSHGLTKEDGVPKHDIEIAIRRRSLIYSNPEKYTAEFNL